MQEQARELRMQRGNLPVKVWAKKIGVPLRTYYRYESGERTIPLDQLIYARRLTGRRGVNPPPS